AIVPAGTNATGSVEVYVTDSTDVIIDINGYFAPQSGITLDKGTATSPSLSFAGDSTTGIFSTGAGTLNFATNGASNLSVTNNQAAQLNLTGAGIVRARINSDSNGGISFALNNQPWWSMATVSGGDLLFYN